MRWRHNDSMLFTKLKVIRAAVIGLVLAVGGRLLLSVGMERLGRFLYSDPASFLFMIIAKLRLHMPAHVGGILGLIWTTIFWTIFVWLIHRLMN